jgi:hypothetical protein
MTLTSACQTGQHPHAERDDDLYETPPVATEALLLAERLPHHCGNPPPAAAPSSRCCAMLGMR